jgi:ectoine hydroxylase-related dioxygenase (phytanoyl-CoA dioxygenase family)
MKIAELFADSCRFQHALGPGITCVERADDDSWFLFRNATAPTAIDHLQRFMVDSQNDFWEIHSKQQGDIARVLLCATKNHIQELVANKEAAVLSKSPNAPILARELARTWSRVGKVMLNKFGFTIGRMVEAEVARSSPRSLGQVWHMDNFVNVWAMSVNLSKTGGSTQILKYRHQGYPEMFGPNTTVPKDWDNHQFHDIKWQEGDVFAFMQNKAHRAGPNATDLDRNIAFAGGSPPTPTDFFSDSAVLTQEEFWDRHR